MKADLVLKNGVIYKADSARTIAEALAVADGKIIYVGDNNGVNEYITETTEIVDLQGKLVLPSFFEGHTHYTKATATVVGINLAGMNTEAEYVEACRNFIAARPGIKLLRGQGYLEACFPGEGPHKEALDKASTEIPIVVQAETLHSPCRAVMMDYQGDGLWKYTMELPASAKKFHYEYLVKSGEGIRREWGSPHSFSPGRNAGKYRLVDRWRDVPANLPFYSSAFIQGIFFRQHADSVVETIEQGTFTVKVDAPQLRPDERLVMVGDCPELGDWDVLKAPLLNDSAFPEWQITLDGRQLKFPFEYKFVIVRTHQREVVAWETGENRICREKPQNPSEAVVVSGLRFNGSESQWRGAGTAIPVFSLRTDYGF